MPDFHDDLEPEFGARFGALHGGVAAAVPVPDADEIVARARRRRRNGHAALAGLAVFSVVTAGFLALGPLRPTGPTVPPGDPARMPVSAYAPPAGANREPAGRSIPTGFVPSDGLTEVREGMNALPGPQCPGRTAFARVREDLVAARAWQLVGTSGSYTLLVYQTGPVGSAAFHEYDAEANRCARASDGALSWTKQVDALTLGAEAIRVTTRYTTTAPGAAAPPTQVQVAVRWGGAVLVVEGPDTVPVQTNAELLERRLCAFARDCAPRDGRPAALRELTVAGEAWAVVLAADVDRAAPKLGRAIAAASEMGYRTSVASIDCDQGARAALGVSADSPYSYVAVYFPTRAAAAEFAARSLVAPVATIAVHTYCLS